MGKVVEIDCEESMKLETSRNVTKSNEVCIGVAVLVKKYLCTFYYSISQKVITLSGRRFITVSGVLLHYRAVITLSGVFYYIIGRFLLHYRAVITVSGVYYIIGWYSIGPALRQKYIHITQCKSIKEDYCTKNSRHYIWHYRHHTKVCNTYHSQYNMSAMNSRDKIIQERSSSLLQK